MGVRGEIPGSGIESSRVVENEDTKPLVAGGSERPMATSVVVTLQSGSQRKTEQGQTRLLRATGHDWVARTL